MELKWSKFVNQIHHFVINRVHKEDFDNASQSAFLHPIVRRFCRGSMITKHHIIEDLAGEWLEDIPIKPLLKFFGGELARTAQLHAVSA